MEPEVWVWNVGEGDKQRRNLACIYTALEHPNCITRHVCRDILASKLVRKAADSADAAPATK